MATLIALSGSSPVLWTVHGPSGWQHECPVIRGAPELAGMRAVRLERAALLLVSCKVRDSLAAMFAMSASLYNSAGGRMKRRGRLGALLLTFGLMSGLLYAQNSVDVARNTGYRDGLEKGRNDAAQAKSYRLDRHDYYRNADHGYRSSFGNKEQYRQAYRENFQRGYEEGYRGRPERGRWRDRADEIGRAPNLAAGIDVARNTGYRDGLEKGRNDVTEGKSYRLERHDYYSDADHGYRESFGNKDQYRQHYREAFQRGYEEAFRGGRVSGGSYGVYPVPSGGSNVADNTGYRDGLEKGRGDAAARRSFNPERHDVYRDADHGYGSRLGSKDLYKQQYRDAFRRGYEEGYRARR